MDLPLRKLLHGKLHGATVTHANLDYEGSILIPENLIEAVSFLPHEAVHVWNVTRGTRFETYILKGTRDSGEIAVNGAAAHLVEVGDKLIIASFKWMGEKPAMEYSPKVAFLNSKNEVTELRKESHPLIG